MKGQALVAIAAAAAVAVSLVALPYLSQDIADAQSTKKIHFTETLSSYPDPGQGYGDRQMALLLSPEEGIIYDGSVTYAADRPVRVAVLHEIDPSESLGQPVWTVDGKTIYGFSLIGGDGQQSGSSEFTGAAIALHGFGPEPFVATASVDGWIRGSTGAVEFVTRTIQAEPDPPPVDLFKASVPVMIPMHGGLYDGNRTLYIVTDASDGDLAREISEAQGWSVQEAPVLAEAPESVLGEIYFFTNGLRGDGLYGFQSDVFSSTPSAQPDQYTTLRKATNISWKPGQHPEVLNSVDEIRRALDNGRMEAKEAGAVLNTPQILWPGGQMKIRDGGAAGDPSPLAGGQILGIDHENMTVTFIAHRLWGPDGGTAYHILTGATPSGPAYMMGVPETPASAVLFSDQAASSELYQFGNGIAGSGALGFQQGIAASVPGDDGYSPMWRTLIVEWNDGNDGDHWLLTTTADIEAARTDGLLTASAARPHNSDHIINGPAVDPFQYDLKG